MLVGVLVPALLSRWRLADPLGLRIAGASLLTVALALVAYTMSSFVRRGRGTPAPWSPPERFVAVGAYSVVRNPMYVGVLLAVLAQSLLFGSLAVLAWAGALAAIFHAFVVLYEEPGLRRRFGAEYDAYRARVPRWLRLRL